MDRVLAKLKELRKQQILRGDFEGRGLSFKGIVPTRASIDKEIERLKTLPVSLNKSFLQVRAIEEVTCTGCMRERPKEG